MWGEPIPPPGTVGTEALEDVPEDIVLGRATPGTGPVEQIPVTAAGRALLADPDAAAQRATLEAAGTAVTNVFTQPQTFQLALKLREDATNFKAYHNLAGFGRNIAAPTGAIVIKTAIPHNAGLNVLWAMRIAGYSYSPDGLFDLTVGAQSLLASFGNHSYTTTGRRRFQVRLGITPDGFTCVILDDVTSVTPYLKILVPELVAGYTAWTDAMAQGWSISLVTDLTGYTALTTVPDRTTLGQVSIAGTDVITSARLLQNVTIFQEAIAAPTLVNGWANIAGNQNAGYWKAMDGMVHLRGSIGSGTVTEGTTIFTLPTGYRPAATELIPVIAEGVYGPSYVEILSTGVVRIYGGSATRTSLSGVRFRV